MGLVPAPASGTGERFQCFDGLRAIAALMIVVTHASFQTGFNRRGFAAPYVARLDMGVSIFFVISGFLLYRPIVLAHLDAVRPVRVVEFWRRRALRIVPAYWVALTIVVFVFRNEPIPDLEGLALRYGLLHIYFTEHVFGPLHQSWSLATEVAFYLLLPCWGWAMAHVAGTPARRLRFHLAGAAFLFLASVTFRIALLVAMDVRDAEFYDPWLPSQLDLFALGMGLAVAWVAGERLHHPIRERLARPLVPTASWVIAGLSFWTVSTRLGLPSDQLYFEPWQQVVRHLLYGVTALFLVLPAVFGPARQGAVRRFLANRTMVWLGLVSYGIYLYHQAWIDAFLALTDARLFDTSFGRTFGATLLLTIPTAALSYYLVERPFLRLKTSPSGKPARRREQSGSRAQEFSNNPDQSR